MLLWSDVDIIDIEYAAMIRCWCIIDTKYAAVVRLTLYMLQWSNVDALLTLNILPLSYHRYIISTLNVMQGSDVDTLLTLNVLPWSDANTLLTHW